jgi:hypothetical protein
VGSTAVLNAANEVAVAAFLEKRIRFDHIHHVNHATLEAVTLSEVSDIEGLLGLDGQAAALPFKLPDNWRLDMLTLISFVVTLGILIAVHEYGHYRVAVACGIKVLKFSIGFGKPIYTWRLKNKSTEFSIGMLPLGGYVKMLDEREAPVDPAERHLAFNTQPLKSRAAVVAAGPAANLLLAVLLYAIVNWSGLQEPKAILASPVAGSLAEKAGLRGHETVEQAALKVMNSRPSAPLRICAGA